MSQTKLQKQELSKNLRWMRYLFALFALILIIGFLFTDFILFKQNLKKNILIQAEENTLVQEKMFQNFLQKSDKTLQSLFISQAFQNKGNQAEDLFLTVAKMNENFMQLRYLDSSGIEKIRVDRKGEFEDARLLKESELQNKESRYYFKDSRFKLLQKTWYSPLDLNMEHGKVEIPFKPTIRAMYPIEKDGVFDGILIINYFMEELLNFWFTKDRMFKYILINDKGEILKHFNNSLSWGQELNPVVNLYTLYPDEAESILSQKKYQTKDFVSKKLDLPLMESLILITLPKYNHILSSERERLVHYIFIFFIIVILSAFFGTLITSRIQRMFRKYIDSLKKLIRENEVASATFMSKDGIVITDSQGRILKANESYERITGYVEKELIGEKPSILKSGYYDAEFYERMWDKIDSEGFWGDEIYSKRKNGEIYPSNLIITKVGDDDEVFYVGIVHDITEQKRSERELIEAKRMAEEASQSKSEFLANMSHEIRTPMTGLLGFMEQLKKTEEDPQRVKKFETARASGETLLSIINDILDFSKIESGKLEVEFYTLNIKLLYENITKIFQELAYAKNIYVSCSMDDSVPPFIMGDETRLKQVLFNLMSNAIKFTLDGGSITLHLDYNKKQSRLLFSVVDTGIGIAEENLEKYFKHFLRRIYPLQGDLVERDWV